MSSSDQQPPELPPSGGPTPPPPVPGQATPPTQPSQQPTQPYQPWQAAPPPGYGTPYPYGAAPVAPPTDDKAVWALVSAIAGFLICPIVLHIVGWALASASLTSIRASGGTLGGEGLAKAARIISIIGLVLYGLGILLFVLVAVLGLAAMPSGDVFVPGVNT
jgi:hypothetical protein